MPSKPPPKPVFDPIFAFNFYCRAELFEPWGLSMHALKGCLWFHAVTSGLGELACEGADPIALARGDFALVKCAHVVRSGASAKAHGILDVPYDMAGDRFAFIEHGGDDASTATLISGVVRFDHSAAAELLDALPPVVHLDLFTSPYMQMLVREAAEVLPGGETVLTRLADVMVVQAIRSWLPNVTSGWLGALQDLQVGPVLAAIHREPDIEWTVSAMAASAEVSRTAFATRFTALVGEAPMQYVRRVRMKAAEEMLTAEPGLTAGMAGTRLGYHSEAAFNRMYKRLIGNAPGAGRKGA